MICAASGTLKKSIVVGLLGTLVMFGATASFGYSSPSLQEKGPSGKAMVQGKSSPAAISASGPPVVRRLTPSQYRATITDIFGPDVSIVGRFERGLRVNGLLAIGAGHAGLSSVSLEQYFESAKSIAAHVMRPESRASFLPCLVKSDTAFDSGCAQKFIAKYGLKLFRRPLTKPEQARYLRIAEDAHSHLGGFYLALQSTLTGMLVSPDFLLRIEHAEPVPGSPGQFRLDAFSRAVRLSYLLTNSTPDDELLHAAASGELDSDAGVGRQADRLLVSVKFERSIRELFTDMLAFDTFGEVSKDPQIFPTFNTNVLADSPEQTLRTVVDLLVTQNGDYRDIFTTRTTFLTRPLGAIYRYPVSLRNGWEKIEFPEQSGRSGILSHVSFLAAQAHSGSSSATLRGKFIRQTFLCQRVPDPPANVSTSLFDGPNAAMPTARMRLAEHNSNPVCAGCHRLTDPLGLTLENFDGVGTFRLTENNAPIDVTGSLNGKRFDGVAEMGRALHDDPQTAHCFVRTLYQSALGHELNGEDPQLDKLSKAFIDFKYRVPALMRAIAVSPNFYSVSLPSPAPAKHRETRSSSSQGDRS